MASSFSYNPNQQDPDLSGFAYQIVVARYTPSKSTTQGDTGDGGDGGDGGGDGSGGGGDGGDGGDGGSGTGSGGTDDGDTGGDDEGGDDEDSKDNPYAVIPNIQCTLVREREGLTPQVAKFSYIFDGPPGAEGWPTQPEQIFALIGTASKSGSNSSASKQAMIRKQYIVQPEDRLVVRAFPPDAKNESDAVVLFDGFAESPEFHLADGGQEVSFEASGVAIRLWDVPLVNRTERDADQPKVAGEETRHLVEDEVKFNPGGIGNCTLDSDPSWQESSGDEVEPSNTWPIFIDPACFKRMPPDSQRWTLDKFAVHLMGVNNDEEFVDNPDFGQTIMLLRSRKPKQGSDFFDPDNASTYDENPIDLVEYDATGKRWPQALEEQLAFNGYGCKYVLESDENGEPVNSIEIYRKDGTGITSPMDVYLQTAGNDLDPTLSNTQEISIVRDYKNTYNSVYIDTKPTLWEVSVILAPGFQPAIGDQSDGNRSQYVKANLANATGTVRDKYRLYVADEAGDGHWNFKTKAWETTAFDFSGIFPDTENGSRTYCRRRRPGLGTLLSVDSIGKPLKADLSLSRNFYAGPGLWDGTGNWQTITGGWELLKDRLGIRVTCEDPEDWQIGDNGGDNPQETSPTLRGVTAIADPDVNVNLFILRLTCVIESDAQPVSIVPPRKTSALTYSRTIWAGAKESFALKKISHLSMYNTSEELDAFAQDDTEKIQDFAIQLQQAHENPAIAGSFLIPYLDNTYPIGEAIRSLKGRDLSLQVNAGTEQSEAKRYPTVVGRTWNLSGRQTTSFELSDHRADPK